MVVMKSQAQEEKRGKSEIPLYQFLCDRRAIPLCFKSFEKSSDQHFINDVNELELNRNK